MLFTGLIGLVIIIGIIIIEVILSRKQNKWLGLIPIAVIVVIWVTVFAWLQYNFVTSTVKTLERDISGGNTMELDVRYDRNNEVIGFGMLDIKSENGELLESIWLHFYENGELEESIIETDSYKDDLYALLDGVKLTGYSLDEEEMGSIAVKESDGLNIRFTGGVKGLLVTITVNVLPLAAIYVIVRVNMRKQRRKNELKKVDVENLK